MAQVGELFFQLGVKGSDKTLAALYDIRKGVDDIASKSFAAKAAIAGVLYAIKALLSEAGDFGKGVLNISDAYGISTKRLQQYEQAAIKAGVATKDLDAAVVSHGENVSKYVNDNVAPKKLPYLQMMTGLTLEEWEDKKNGFENTINAIQKLYAMPGITDLVKKDTAQSILGASDLSLLYALNHQKFATDIVNKQPFKSEGQIGQLAEIQRQMSLIKNDIDNQWRDFASENGVQFLKDFRELNIQFLALLTQLNDLAKKLGIFHAIAVALEYAAAAIQIAADALTRAKGGTPAARPDNVIEKDARAMTNKALDNIKNDKVGLDPLRPWVQSIVDYGKEKGKERENTLSFDNPAVNGVKALWGWLTEKGQSDDEARRDRLRKETGEPLMDIIGGSMIDFLKNSFLPNQNLGALGDQGGMQNVVINQDINFNHDGSNYQQTASSMENAFVNAWKVTPKNIRVT